MAVGAEPVARHGSAVKIELVRASVQQLRAVLEASLTTAQADGILLSGGLDTSAIAALAPRGPSFTAVTVCVRQDEPVDEAHRSALAAKLGCDPAMFPCPDARYAQQCADALGLRHEICWVTLEELLSYAPATIAAIRSFDPMQIRNGLTIYCALRRTAALGVRRVLTGDGADEMYAGYSHMWSMGAGQLTAYLRHMATIMRFTTSDLAAAAGVQVASPFTEAAVVNFALELPADALVGTREGRLMGKWILRHAVVDLLPPELVWRVKTPIEYGSGSTFLGPLLDSRISDEEFHDAQASHARQGLKLREKEQLYYYRIFETVCGSVSSQDRGPGDCPYCGALISPPDRNYCGVCGAWGFHKQTA